MFKVNDLKNLRSSSITDSKENRDLDELEAEGEHNVNIMNSSNNNLSNVNKLTISNSRIEINAATNNLKKEKKIFMTDNQLSKFDNPTLFTFHDMIVPGGKNAKLCMLTDPYNKNLRVTEIADHFKFYEPTPVIVLIGANTRNKGKLFAGLSRAALNTNAIIIDSGLNTGVEKFCLRKNIHLIGVAPETMIEYPILNPEAFSNKMLTNGHTHFILLPGEKYKWGDEFKFKVSFAERLASGRKSFSYKSKVVGVILGNIPNCENEISLFIEKNWPLILIEDSEFSQKIKSIRNGEDINKQNYLGDLDANIEDKFITKIAKYSKIIEIDDDSEILASAVHICLSISI